LSPFSPRRKRGLLIGVGLLSAAALVAFGSSKARSRRSQVEPHPENGNGHEPTEAVAEPTLIERAREMAQAAWLLVTQRRPNDS
jgi:hypothetical protein